MSFFFMSHQHVYFSLHDVWFSSICGLLCITLGKDCVRQVTISGCYLYLNLHGWESIVDIDNDVVMMLLHCIGLD